MSTVEERVRRERLAQGLPERIQDHDVLDQVAAILLAAAEHQDEEGGGRRARTA
jgi:hypothetical protein